MLRLSLPGWWAGAVFFLVACSYSFATFRPTDYGLSAAEFPISASYVFVALSLGCIFAGAVGGFTWTTGFRAQSLLPLALVYAALYVSVLTSASTIADINFVVIQAAQLFSIWCMLSWMLRAGVHPIVSLSAWCVLWAFASLAFALLLPLIGVLLTPIGTFHHPPFYPRLIGWSGNPNVLATWLGLGVIFCVARLWISHRRRWWWGVAVVPLGLGTILAGSTAVLAALVVAAPVTAALTLQWGRILGRGLLPSALGRVLVFVLGLSMVGLVWSVFDRESFDAVFSRQQDLDRIATATGRTEIWRSYLGTYLDSGPWQQAFGFGRLYLTQTFGESAHSFYVRALLEFGGVFVLLFLGANLIVVSSAVYRFHLTTELPDRWAISVCIAVVIFLLVRAIATPTFFESRLEFFVYLFCVLYLCMVRRPEAPPTRSTKCLVRL